MWHGKDLASETEQRGETKTGMGQTKGDRDKGTDDDSTLLSSQLSSHPPSIRISSQPNQLLYDHHVDCAFDRECACQYCSCCEW